MREAVATHLDALASAHAALAESLPEPAFRQKLGVPSNTIGAQYWCVVGARESYAKAIEKGEWAGFECSLSNHGTKADVVAALRDSEQHLARVLATVEEWTESRHDLLLDLLEHEAQHQGQLIRYVYALGHTFPESWVDRWALGQ